MGILRSSGVMDTSTYCKPKNTEQINVSSSNTFMMISENAIRINCIFHLFRLPAELGTNVPYCMRGFEGSSQHSTSEDLP